MQHDDRHGTKALFLATPLVAVLGLAGALASGAPGLFAGPFAGPSDGAALDALDDARDTIQERDVERHVAFLAAPELEGRDSPSVGLDTAAAYLSTELERYGFQPASGDDFRVAFSRALPAPDPDGCRLTIGEGDAARRAFGADFVPLPACAGSAKGEALFVGFGIDRSGFDDLAKKRLKGKIAVLVEGEPRHKRLFDGPDELSEAADVYDKVRTVLDAGAVGVLVARRPPVEATEGPDGEDLAPPSLGYRYTWADWNPATTEQGPRRRRSFRSPVVEVTPEVASLAVGQDVLALSAKSDKTGKPARATDEGLVVELKVAFRNQSVAIHNVVGRLEGSDPELADEFVVLGAHYDHIGVDPRGRIGFGADDNASGTAAMLEVAEALASAPPRRSILVAFFGAEEDGLLGSRNMADAPPVDRDALVAMLNMDMVGRGKARQVVVLGTEQNPDLGDVLKAAQKLGGTGIRDVVTNKAQHLWQRSDHYSFHRAGVPVLFFFEAVSETLNRDYHTFRDTPDLVDHEKIANTARLCLNTAWLVANADERPSKPKR